MQQYISIPKPCNENWDNMTPHEQGRHCTKCNMVVKDFSGMATEEIIQFINQKAGRVCGNFEIKDPQQKRPLTNKLKRFLYALALVFLPFIPLNNFAQSTENQGTEDAQTRGSIKGNIIDENNEAIPFVHIYFSQNGMIKGHAKSTFQGAFRVDHLPPGKYDLKVSSVSYKKRLIAEVEVMAGQTTNLNSIAMKRSSKVLNKIVIRSKYYPGGRRHGGACVITRNPQKDVNKIINPYRAGRQFVSPQEIRNLPGGYR